MKQLALDTLFGNQISGPRNSSFRTNKAGIELARCDVGAIEAITNVIETEVIASQSLGSFRGLDYLIGAYLVIAVRNNHDEAFSYLSELPDQVLEYVIRSASTFFWKTSDGYNFGVSPNARLVLFLQSLAERNPTFSELVSRVLDQYERAGFSES